MHLCLTSSKNSYLPVSCLLTKNLEIKEIAHSTEEMHAELFICNKFPDLREFEIFIPLEPCPMCTFALCLRKIKTIYFGAYNKQYGVLGGKINLFEQIDFSYVPKFYGGILEEESEELVKKFFCQLRKEKKLLNYDKICL